MSPRRLFIRNSLMAIAASLVPRVLQPCLPEVMEDKEIEVEVVWSTYMLVEGNLQQIPSSGLMESHFITMKQSEYDKLHEGCTWNFNYEIADKK